VNGSKLCNPWFTDNIADFSARHHVFADLRPYMCTFPECKDSDKTYRTRLRFVNHELKEHRGRWIYHCAIKDCHETFNDLRARINHIKTHPLGPVRSTPEVMANPVEGSDCLFCGKRIEAGKLNLARHLGRHMEEISFAVITKTYEDWESYEHSSHADSLDSPPVIPIQNIFKPTKTG